MPTINPSRYRRYLSRSLATFVFGAWLWVAGTLTAPQASAQNPGWSPVIIPTGEYRAQIKSMPIEQRPYRPLHFYGNTVRRNYYRGTSNGQFAEQQSGSFQAYRPAAPTLYSPTPANVGQPVQSSGWSLSPYQSQRYPVYSQPTSPAAQQWAPPQYPPAQTFPPQYPTNQYAPVQSWYGSAW